MTRVEKDLICATLRELSLKAVQSNSATAYPGFGVLRGDKFRLAVHVGAKGATFFTENMPVFSEDVVWKKIESNKGRDKKRFLFSSLSLIANYRKSGSV